jgi:rhodanese-related sulfurtransferase
MEIDPTRFAAAHADGAFVLDVREPHEYVAGHVPGAELVPLGQVQHSAHLLPNGRPVYVICATGNRSLFATQMLRQAGIDAYSVAGGTTAWQTAGRPVVQGQRAA